MQTLLLLGVLLFVPRAQPLQKPIELSTRSSHKCIHDEIVDKHEHVYHSKIHPEAHGIHKDIYTLKNQQQSWESIRIAVDWSGFTDNGQFGNFIRNVVFPRAVKIIQDFLRVQRNAGNLILHLFCYKYYTNPYKCISYGPQTCGEANMPDSHVAEKGGTGIPDADFVFYVLSKKTEGNTLAYAASCQYATNGRPIAGFANFGPRSLDVSKEHVINEWVAVSVHEMFHALGFSKNSFKDFINSGTGKAYYPITSFWERDMNVSKFIGPISTYMARRQFNCSTLNGVELESNGGSGTAGSHLEQRIFDDSIMSGVSRVYGRLGSVELGVFEDSGWYKPIYPSANKDILWGKGEGCLFATAKCLNPPKSRPTVNFRTYFCANTSKSQELGCSRDREVKTVCSFSQWSGALPTAYQYFTDPTLGGTDETVDYCPTFLPVGSGECRDTDNRPATNYWGETYGSDTFCLQSTLEDESFTRYYVSQGVGCYRVTCASSPNFKVSVNGVSQICSARGTRLNFRGFRGVIVCPEWKEVCA